MELRPLFDKLVSEMCVVVENYYIWRTLVFSRSTVESGNEALPNAQALNRYKYFFHPLEYSLMCVFISGLLKFFDSHPRALSIEKLIRMVEIEKGEDLTDIRTEHSDLLLKYEGIIGPLKSIRDQRIAHCDIEQIDSSFIPTEAEDLIKMIQTILNNLSRKLDGSTTRWQHLEHGSVRTVESLICNIRREG